MENTCKITTVSDAAEGVASILFEEPWRMKLGTAQVADVTVASGGAEGKSAVLPILQVPGKQELEIITSSFPGIAAGDALDIADVRDGVDYRGPGKIIVEGDGIGLGLSIARALRSQSKTVGHAYFVNKLADHYFYYQAPTLAAMVARTELRNLFAGHFTGALTSERQEGYWFGRIEDDFLLHIPRELNGELYLAGSADFLAEVKGYLLFYGAKEDKIQTVQVGAAPVAA